MSDPRVGTTAFTGSTNNNEDGDDENTQEVTKGSGRLWFDFMGSKNANNGGVFVEDEYEATANQRMGKMFDTFNDIGFYRSLRREKGCIAVDLSSILVRHNRHCHGIQSIYRLVFEDGTSEYRTGPRNFFSRGCYDFSTGDNDPNVAVATAVAGGGSTRVTSSYIHLRDNEYITGLKVKEGNVLDGIVFRTNQRTVHCDGSGGSWLSSVTVDLPPSTRIVAFCGTVYGVTERIGFYAKPMAWDECLGAYILMRELVQKGRAEVRMDFQTNAEAVSGSSPGKIRTLNAILERLNGLDDGVFRRIMKILA